MKSLKAPTEYSSVDNEKLESSDRVSRVKCSLLNGYIYKCIKPALIGDGKLEAPTGWSCEYSCAYNTSIYFDDEKVEASIILFDCYMYNSTSIDDGMKNVRGRSVTESFGF